MQTVFLGDNLNGMSKPSFCGNKLKQKKTKPIKKQKHKTKKKNKKKNKKNKR